jgi:hypothetical protein
MAGTHTRAQFKSFIGRVMELCDGTLRETVLDVVANDRRDLVLAEHEFGRKGQTHVYRVAHLPHRGGPARGVPRIPGRSRFVRRGLVVAYFRTGSEHDRGEKDADHDEGDGDLDRRAYGEADPRGDTGLAGLDEVSLHRELAEDGAEKRADDDSG